MLAKVASKVTHIAKALPKDSKPIKNGCSSFAAGTFVWTPDGLRAIETLKVGDLVLARNDESFFDTPRPITQLMNREVAYGVPAKILRRTPFYDASGRRIGEYILYQVPRKHGHGPDVNKAVRDQDGNVLYKQEKAKTVYDPSVISDNEMISRLREVGTEVYCSKLDDFVKSGDPSMDFTYAKEGVHYTVYLKKDAQGNPYVDNVHLISEPNDLL